MDLFTAELQAVETELAPPPSYPVEFLDDGTPYNPETGEVYETSKPGIQARVVWPTISTREEADEALEKRAKIEADMAALVARRKALCANIDAQLKALTERLNWWDVRYWSGVVAIARTLLKGKSKTAVLDFGKVSFKVGKPSSTIIDMDQAIKFVEDWQPDLVKVTKSVTLTVVNAALAKAREACGLEEFDRLPFVVTSDPGETVTIKTGIGKDVDE